MAAKKVASALHVLTSDGILGCEQWSDNNAFEALVTDYFTGSGNDSSEESDDDDIGDGMCECTTEKIDYDDQDEVEMNFELFENDPVVSITQWNADTPNELVNEPESSQPDRNHVDLPQPSHVSELHPSTTLSSVTTTFQPAELRLCKKFVETTCGCKKFNGKPCSNLFSLDHYIDLRTQSSFLTHDELDLTLLGCIMCTIIVDEHVRDGRHKPVKRRRTSISFIHHAHEVCKTTFCFLYGIGRRRVMALKESYLANGLETRIHGNRKQLPHNHLTHAVITNVVKFLQTYAQENAILLPGCIPGYKRDDIKLLPSSRSKKSIWTIYKEACLTSGIYSVAYTTFCNYWRTLLPYIIVGKPMSDLCWTCQQNSSLILKAVNKSTEEKSAAIKAAEEHIHAVTKERSYYRSICEKSQENIKTLYSSTEPPPPHSIIRPLCNDVSIHYSFDMAQQVHYPNDPMQPGPIYFLTPCKCAIFGVCCESVPRQVNYLIDEAHSVGKGANSIISMLHHYFHHHGFGETKVHLHADNCTGKNKNRFMMFYLMWRVLVGLHKEITISFLLVGHTKFSPDWCFGLFKQMYRRTKVGSISDIAEVVKRSATVNYPQLVGEYDGSTYVEMYDWSSCFDNHTIQTSLKGISKMHHFRFTADHPGFVFIRNFSDDTEKKIKLVRDLSWRPSKDSLPEQIIPPGLSLERQWYLYNKIREFFPDDVKDLVCPKPARPLS